MMTPKFKLTKAVRGKVKIGIVALAVGIAVGIMGTLFIQAYNPKDEPVVDNVSVVFSRVVQQNELVCASQDYTFVEKASDTNKLFDFIEIPFSENSFWYRYSGTIKVAVNMEDAQYEQHGSRIAISLTNPYVSSNTPDMDVSGVLEERNNILNPIHIEDVDAFQRDCIERSEEIVESGSLYEEARANAEDNLTRMFTAALGDSYEISFEWREEK